MAKRPVGRPRKPPSQQAKTAEGYTQQTIGPPGNGKRVYQHRLNAGLGNVKGSQAGGKVVDHGDANRGNNSKANLKIISKSANTAKSNRRRGR